MIEHLRTQRRSNSYTLSSASEAQKTYVTLHLALAMPQKSIKEWNLIKESRKYGMFGVRGVQCLMMGEIKQIGISSLKS